MDIKASEYPLFNVKTRERELLDDDLVNDAILGGTHSFPAGARVPVFDPDGRKASIGADELRAALKEGFRVIGPKSLAIDEYLRDNDNLSGMAKVFFGQAMDEFAFGVPELVMDYSEDPFEAAKREALKKQFEVTNALGGITGFGLSAALGGAPVRAGTAFAKSLSEAGKRAVAARIAKGAVTEEAAEKVAGGILSRLGGKTADGLAEGIVLSTPHAITEAAFSDHEAAAESMLYGTIAGGVFGAGAGLAGELFNVGKSQASRFYSWAEGKPLTGAEVAKKASRVVTGVPEEHIEYLADDANLERMIRRKPEGGYDVIIPEKEAIKDEAEAVLNAVKENYEQAQLSYGQIETTLHDEYKRELAEISARSAPEPVIKQVKDYLLRMKEQSGDLRIRFDNTLKAIHQTAFEAGDPETIRRIPFYIPKQTITKMLNTIDNGLKPESAALGRVDGPAFSPSKNKAFSELMRVKGGIKNYFDQITEMYGKDMPGMDLLFARNLVREMDDLADYGVSVGAFDSEVSRTIKEAQNEIRDAIHGKLADLQKKDLTPFMDEMSQDAIRAQAREASVLWGRQIQNAQVLSRASNYFANDIRTANALTAMTGKNFRASEIAKVLADVEREAGEPITDLLDEWIRKRELLAEAKIGGKAAESVRATLFPEQTELLMRARERALAAEAEWKPLKNFNARRLEAAINRIDYKNASIEDTRRLELLGELRDKYFQTPDVLDYKPRNFAQEAKDRAVWDSFDQARLNGSRKAVMGGSLGTALFSIFGPQAAMLGGALGAGVGGTIDYYGGKMLRDYVINGNNYRGLLFVEKQLKSVAKSLDGIGSAVDSFAKRAPFPIERSVRAGGIQSILGIKSDFNDRRKHWEAIQEKVAELAANPDLLIEKVSTLSGALTLNGAPSIGGRYNEKLMKTIQYIIGEMPKSPRGHAPFAPDVKWRPSDYELKLFDDKLEVIANPFTVIDRMKDRSISKGHVSALKAVYPRIYEEIKWRTGKELSERKETVTRGDRIKLSILFGSEFDSGLSPKGILASQAIYQEAQSETEQGLAREKMNVKTLANQYQTAENQRSMRS